MKPREFIEKWRRSTRTEKSAAQEHFLDLCELLEIEKPGAVDPEGNFYTFEKHVVKTDGTSGFVDVWRKSCFAWEYKRSYKGNFNHKNLVKAHGQVRQYADALANPPLLIVSDMKEIRVHTNFTNTVSEQHVLKLPDINDPQVRRLLKWCFTNPERLRPEITREGVTAKAAMALGAIAAKLGKKYDPRRVAHFLNKLVFCMFAEDIGLLPDDVFADILEEGQEHSPEFADMLGDLFRAMKDKNGRFGRLSIPWFNGGLFDDDDVLPLGYYEIRDLADAARLDWSAIEPAIFGTMFERGLDPDKRKQMASLFDAYGVEEESTAALPGILNAPAADKGVGIHYTDPETIMKIVEPVVLRPLRHEWEEVKAAIAKKRKAKDGAKSDAARTKAENAARALYWSFRERLGAFRVFDAACGSGNFLYLSLQHLKDFDLRVSKEADKLGLPLDDQRVGPETVLGLEINPYAAELARATIWIGELQWQLRHGFGISRAPILSALNGIVNKDALVNADGTEVIWPAADAIIGNPPFLGTKRLIAVLGEEYVAKLRAAYDRRLPQEADLVTFWFAKAGDAIADGRAKYAGLVATNSIRGGASRRVLDGLTKTAPIYDAWDDEPWVVEGAAVRVSLISFTKEPVDRFLDGQPVREVFTNLTAPTGESHVNLTKAQCLGENRNVAFMGDTKGGAFDIPGELAREWLRLPLNPNGRPNADVLRSWVNGMDVTRRPRDKWIIDFPHGLDEKRSSLYEAPFAHVLTSVRPFRESADRRKSGESWWHHVRPRPEMRSAIDRCDRFLATPTVAKFRLFVWLLRDVVPDHQLIAIARDDDTTFGILHSRFHEAWSLRLGTWLGKGNDPRYTPSTTFETFPFPEGMAPDIPAVSYVDDPRAVAVAAAAKDLNEKRETWLNPPDLVRCVPEVVPGYPDRTLAVSESAGRQLRKRTLTNLYNERPAWLDHLHRALDATVAAAYGWSESLTDDEVIERLFELNQERARA